MHTQFQTVLPMLATLMTLYSIQFPRWSQLSSRYALLPITAVGQLWSVGYQATKEEKNSLCVLALCGGTAMFKKDILRLAVLYMPVGSGL